MLRVPIRRLEAGDVTLDADASHYVGRVRRAREGDELLLFEPALRMEASATIVEIGRTGVRCSVGPVRPSGAQPRRAVTLVQAVTKADKTDAIVRDATELAATRIVIAETARSIAKAGDRAPARRDRWSKIAVEAARQCGRGDAPEIMGPLSWTDALAAANTPADGATTDAAIRICLWEGAVDPVGPVLLGGKAARAPLVVAVGPEGGFERAEIDLARAHGFSILSLGPFILRAETVAAAVLGAVVLLGSEG